MRDLDASVTTHETPPRAVVSGAVLDVARHWLATGGDSFRAHRTSLDPLALNPAVLPQLWLIDHDAANDDFRFRLAGESINDMFGKPVRGALLSGLFDSSHLDILRRRFLRVLTEPCVCYCRAVSQIDGDRHGWNERLVLPMADGNGTLRHLLGVMHAHPLDDDGRAAATANGVEERFFQPDGLRLFCDAAA